MEDEIAFGGHVMSKNMADDLIVADSVKPNLILTSDM